MFIGTFIRSSIEWIFAGQRACDTHHSTRPSAAPAIVDALAMAADRMIDGFLPIPPDLRRYRHCLVVANKTDLPRPIPIRQGCGNTHRHLPAASKKKATAVGQAFSISTMSRRMTAPMR
ncbi:hypothetical protein [Lysobacter capsici]|uniref:hypothetical protein n=1 Tax=Lysobacter capsici TaxID=435897 RepID=UPI0012FD6FF8|nr:hypothetical protein [Lysobacter capsici]